MGDVTTADDLREEWANVAAAQSPGIWPTILRWLVAYDFANARAACDGFDWPDPTWVVETGPFGGGTYYGWVVDVQDESGIKINGGIWR